MKRRNISFLMGLLIAGCSFEKESRIPELPEDEPLATNIFRAGDTIGVYPVGYSGGIAGKPGDIAFPMNLRYTFDGRNWISEDGEPLFWDDTTLDLYAYYPYDGGIGSDAAKRNIYAYPFDLSGNQGVEEKDFLWAKVSLSPQSSNTTGFSFTHSLAKFTVAIDFGAIEASAVSVTVHNTYTSVDIDLSTGEAVVSGNAAGTITAAQVGADRGSGIRVFEAIVAPQQILPGTPLFLIEYDGAYTLYEQQDQIAVYSGTEYIFNLTFSRSGRTQLRGVPAVHAITE